MPVLVTSHALVLAQAFIKSRESCSLTAYRDQKGIWTIGWGHTGPEVVEGLTWTQDQADAQLLKDMQEAASAVARLCKGPLSDRQIAALISFAFNLGAAALASSTLLRLVNVAEWIAAAREWVRWDHIGANENKGLLIRRMLEAVMFLEGSP